LFAISQARCPSDRPDNKVELESTLTQTQKKLEFCSKQPLKKP